MFFSVRIYSQEITSYGLLPSLNLNKKLGKGWEINAKAESRQIFFTAFSNKDNNFKYKYSRTDFSVLTAKSTGLSSKLIAGYLLKTETDIVYHRFIQQFSFVNSYKSIRVGHRFAADQTISKESPPEFRLRYKISTEIPLRGEDVNYNEFYFKLSNEYLNSLQDNNYDLEIRVNPCLGYNFTNSNKLETGIRYDTCNFINNNAISSFWLQIKWYLVL